MWAARSRTAGEGARSALQLAGGRTASYLRRWWHPTWAFQEGPELGEERMAATMAPKTQGNMVTRDTWVLNPWKGRKALRQITLGQFLGQTAILP